MFITIMAFQQRFYVALRKTIRRIFYTTFIKRSIHKQICSNVLIWRQDNRIHNALISMINGY